MEVGRGTLSTLPFMILALCVKHKGAANSGLESSLLNRLPVEATSTQPTPLVQTGHNITAQNGATVVLHCRVDHLEENTTVSWLRRRGDRLDLVSVGHEVYSSDPRYLAKLNRDDWTLTVGPLNVSDRGHYECQVSSHPPVVRSLFLHVIVPQSEIEDERRLPIKNKFYNSGSTIELRCIISKIPQPTQFIVWKHNSSVLNYDTTRGGISVKTDMMEDGAQSLLYVANVGPSDSGNYTCSLGEMAVTSVSVIVITGETPAAMQHGSSPKLSVAPVVLLIILLSFR